MIIFPVFPAAYQTKSLINIPGYCFLLLTKEKERKDEVSIQEYEVISEQQQRKISHPDINMNDSMNRDSK